MNRFRRASSASNGWPPADPEPEAPVDGEPAATDRKLVAWLVFVGVFAALNYAGRFAGGAADRDALYNYGFAVAGAIELGIVLTIVYLIARGADVRELFALRRPRSWPVALGLGVAVLVGVFALAAILEPLLRGGEEQGLVPEKWRPDRAAAFALNFVVVAALAPVVEELTFRGLGFSLLSRYGRWVAVAGVAVAFGLIHGLVEALPLLTAFGAGLALLRWKTESVYPPMLVHSFFNALVLVVAVA